MQNVSSNEKRRKEMKGSLSIDIIFFLLNTLLLLTGLLFSRNIIFIKQNTVLHVLERVKETQVKVLSEEPDLPDGLVEALFMLFHDLFLVNEQLLLKLLVGLPLPSSSYLGLLQHGLHSFN